ncbi:5'-methylthioadenosine/S-adenosylhomocysteine nucleosidase [Sciscionella marina]|uniref:5'-methylthioadenosine/S-adenosylhomocysteine nucleosidase family protein n=1 Tax=Sciscionella marina TaxID=508770 RepID=UPI001F096462|nr:5'-methylthioadenosine/S-adenosylhomocysteine nucleosidase [Sciscionella marina]
MTALPVEHEAMCAHLSNIGVHRHQAGTVFKTGHLEGTDVAVACIGQGNNTAASLAERAIAEFQPFAMFFVGVAGGLRPWLELGDVVFGTRIYAYHGGKQQDQDFLARPRAWEASHLLEQEARLLARSAKASELQVHFDPIAAGEVVLNSQDSTLGEQLRHNYNDAVAIEMESAGIATAGQLNHDVHVATIRGISDHADGNKERVDATGSQSAAADNAATFAAELIAALPDDKPESRQETGEPRQQAVQNTNIASGNAQVGQQIGTISGVQSIQFGNAPDQPPRGERA